MQAKQGKEFVYYFTSAHTCSATSRKAGLIMCNGSSRGKKKSHHHNIPFSSFLAPAFIAEHCAMWYGTFLWAVWVSCPVSVLSAPCAPQILAGKAA